MNQRKSYSVMACSLFMYESNNLFLGNVMFNDVHHVNSNGCIILMHGDECCYVSYIFNVMVFN